jgi:uncharacterized protein YqeY
VSLTDRLQAELTAAMRARDDLRRETLRMAIAAAYNAEKAARRPLTEDEALAVLAREVKTRRESVDAYRKADRPELAAKEEAEITILSGFLPEQLAEDELRTMVRAAITESGATSARDLGRVMGLLAPRTRGRADGRTLSGMVAAELAQRDLAGHDTEHQGSET